MEIFICKQIWECVVELVAAVLHQAKSSEGKYTHSKGGERPPMPIQVHIYSIMKNTISASDCVSFHSFSEITRFFWQTLKFIWWLSGISFVET